VFQSDGRVLACRRGPGKVSEGLWEFPGGKVESEEDSRSALSRELLEELGVNVAVGKLLDRSTTAVGSVSIDLSCYRVATLGEAPTVSTDHDQMRWVTPDEAAELEWAAPDLPMVAKLRPVIADR
jgi:8-oxo-dGTP diphosphatase